MKRMMVLLAALLLLGLSPLPQAAAQTFPTRTVKFIVPFGPASGTDIVARLIGDRLAARWGKPVVIENRPGADGFVAINAFTSANDDHTLLFVPVGTFAVHPYTHDKVPYDVDRDLLPIANVATIVLSLAAPASLKVNTLKEFVDLVHANPGKFNAAAATGNSDFLLGGFLKNYNLQMAKVPYRDIMQGPNDLSESRIHLLASSLTIVQPLAQAGRIKVLAVTSRKRAPSSPEVPTVAEAGFAELQLESLIGLFAQRGTPAALRARIAADIRAVMDANPDIGKKLEATGMVVDVRDAAGFAAGIAELRGKLADIAKTLGMKAAQ
jgi:tripartite-type tricarboxylate transporter receptor subunit TctC